MNRKDKSWDNASSDLVAMATLQVMTRLASEDGIVRATPEQLAARAGLPVEIIDRGVSELQRPIASGFSRITRLRDLSGWQLSNYGRLK